MIYAEDGAIGRVEVTDEKTMRIGAHQHLCMRLRVTKRFVDSPIFGALPREFDVSRRTDARETCGWAMYHDAPPVLWGRNKGGEYLGVGLQGRRYEVTREQRVGRTNRRGPRYVLRIGGQEAAALRSLTAAKDFAQALEAVAAGDRR